MAPSRRGSEETRASSARTSLHSAKRAGLKPVILRMNPIAIFFFGVITGVSVMLVIVYLLLAWIKRELLKIRKLVDELIPPLE